MRRGASQAEVITVVLISVFVVLGSIIYANFNGLAKTQTDIATCKSSILLSAQSEVNALCMVPTPSFNLKCERKFVTVSKDGVTIDGKDQTSKYSDACPAGSADCLPQNVLAQEMAKCWDLFEQGDAVVFQKTEKSAFSFVQRDPQQMRTCFVCAEVAFDGVDASQFRDYLKNTNYEPGMSYYDVFSGGLCDPSLVNSSIYDDLAQKPKTCWDAIATGREPRLLPGRDPREFPVLDQDSFPKDSVYAVTFIRRGLGECKAEAQTLLDKVSGTRITVTNTIQAIPADQISRYCTTVVA